MEKSERSSALRDPRPDLLEKYKKCAVSALQLLRPDINNNGDIRHAGGIINNLAAIIVDDSIQPDDQIASEACIDSYCLHCQRKTKIDPDTGEVSFVYVCDCKKPLVSKVEDCSCFDDSLPF